MMLSPHFALDEFLRSEVAARAGLDITIDDPAIQANLQRWCLDIGEPLRIKIGRPIVILSGYRPPWLNNMVGGAGDSAHLYGCAADILVPGLTVASVCNIVSKSGLPFDQTIYEFGRWTHIAIARVGAAARSELLTSASVNGHTVYSAGLPA